MPDSAPQVDGNPLQAQEKPSSAELTDLIELSHGKGLNLREATNIARDAFTSVVLFAGTAKSGKTTLLASLLLLFQKGPFAGYLFAGAGTLIGYETRNYYVLCASKAVKPTTPRTIVSEYLHLQLRSEDLSEQSRDLLLCDFSGEEFRTAKDSTDDCKKLEILKRADRVVLLVDGEKLADPTSRKRAKNDPMTLLRRCLDSEMLGMHSTVDIVFTKWDLIEACADKDEAIKFVEYVEGEFQRQFSTRLRALRMARVAAHPFTQDLPLGYGLDSLLPSWVESFDDARRVERPLLQEKPGLPESDRYLKRRLPGRFVKG